MRHSGEALLGTLSWALNEVVEGAMEGCAIRAREVRSMAAEWIMDDSSEAGTSWDSFLGFEHRFHNRNPSALCIFYGSGSTATVV